MSREVRLFFGGGDQQASPFARLVDGSSAEGVEVALVMAAAKELGWNLKVRA